MAARTAKLSVMLAEKTKQDIKTMADKMGVTESALAAFILGNWVATQQAVNTNIIDLLNSPKMLQAITGAAVPTGGQAETK